MSENTETIRAFINAWANLDAEELVSYFADDGVYHNMPASPISGRENLLKFIGGFISPWSSTDWEIVNLAGAGDTVFAERVDKTTAGDKQVNLPCCGVFEMRDGKISVWRDYFDMQTYVKAMS